MIEKPTHFNEKIKQEGKEILEKAAKTLQEFDVKHKTLMIEGHPASTIIDYAANHSFDLLMIGGRTGLEKLVMGSVSSAVVQEVNCDVLVVKFPDVCKTIRKDTKKAFENTVGLKVTAVNIHVQGLSMGEDEEIVEPEEED